MRELVMGLGVVAGAYLFISFTAPTEQAMNDRFRNFCLTAQDTKEHPYVTEQCRLTFVYGIQATEWDLLLYHYRQLLGKTPLGVYPSERDEAMQRRIAAALR